MELKKTKLFWSALLIIVVFATDIFFYSTKWENKKTSPQTPTAQLRTEKKPVSSEPATIDNKPKDSASSTKSINLSSAAYLTTEPEIESKKIYERAQALNEKQKIELKQNSINWNLNQDLRFESVFLLSQAPNAEDQLAEIALTPIPASAKDRTLDFETILRAQAIEGLQNSKDKPKAVKLLNLIANKSDNIFLIDHSKRANNYIKNGGDSIETQDNKILKAMLDE